MFLICQVFCVYFCKFLKGFLGTTLVQLDDNIHLVETTLSKKKKTTRAFFKQFNHWFSKNWPKKFPNFRKLFSKLTTENTGLIYWICTYVKSFNKIFEKTVCENPYSRIFYATKMHVNNICYCLENRKTFSCLTQGRTSLWYLYY